ncbi:hypothetical protein EIH07_03820 [Chryseobacterium taklimakanense]|uniref:hypothetical protein n=1 Tax=Chryseobacterium taklimakanense TaxID=536441 RepID=UPI000F5DDCFC|nr:hypothetical protein [Chryseobacterium taklimakanense]AZI22234.1 hypothetical protein EIH07_03820 [Chryseobacterium taklimakanense]
MKKHLYIYGSMILLFIVYNQFFQIQDDRINTIVNILFASFLFLYIAFMAIIAIRKMKNSSKK